AGAEASMTRTSDFAAVCAPAPHVNSRIADRTGKSLLRLRLIILLIIRFCPREYLFCLVYSGGTFGPARKPPSRTKLCPVMNPAAPEHIHKTASATSIGLPNRAMG